jgi:hypothetical protein
MDGTQKEEYVKFVKVQEFALLETLHQQRMRTRVRSSSDIRNCVTQVKQEIMADSTTSVTVSKKSFGVKYMEEQRAVLVGMVDKQLKQIESEVDRVAQEREAWKLLGAVGLYDRKQKLERELEEIEAKMAPFNGNKCSRDHYYYEDRRGTALEKARVEAKKLLYPEIEVLKELAEEVSIRTTMSCATAEFKELYEWIKTELQKYKV